MENGDDSGGFTTRNGHDMSWLTVCYGKWWCFWWIYPLKMWCYMVILVYQRVNWKAQTWWELERNDGHFRTIVLEERWSNLKKMRKNAKWSYFSDRDHFVVQRQSRENNTMWDGNCRGARPNGSFLTRSFGHRSKPSNPLCIQMLICAFVDRNMQTHTHTHWIILHVHI